jgi:hypothetical protein
MTKYKIFHLKRSLFIPYTGAFVHNKVARDIFSPFDLCLTRCETYFTYPARESSQALCGNMYLQFTTDILGFKTLERVYISINVCVKHQIFCLFAYFILT